MTNETDRIQCAIRHIQTAVDVDPWAVEIAVEAMQKQIPMKSIKHEPIDLALFYRCPVCDNCLNYYIPYCGICGQAIDWSEEG